jgi:hypothetical protein
VDIPSLLVSVGSGVGIGGDCPGDCCVSSVLISAAFGIDSAVIPSSRIDIGWIRESGVRVSACPLAATLDELEGVCEVGMAFSKVGPDCLLLFGVRRNRLFKLKTDVLGFCSIEVFLEGK